MSADLLDDGEDDEGVSVMVEMNVHNTCFLTLMASKERGSPDEPGEELVTLTLRPNEKGIALAKRLQMAFEVWLEQVL